MTRKRRPVLMLTLASIIIAIQLYDLDYSDLSWNMNFKNYLKIIGIILIIVGVIIENLQGQKEKNRKL